MLRKTPQPRLAGPTILRGWLWVVGGLSAVLIACSSTDEPAASPTALPSASPPDQAASQPQVRVALAVTDIAVGPNRFAFGILDRNSEPVRVLEAKVSFLYLETYPFELRGQATASFVEWPGGNAGVYSTDVSFDKAGRWGAIVEVTRPDGTVAVGQPGFVVKEQSSAPGIGKPVPSSRNKTASDTSDLTEITTSAVPDPDLYQLRIVEAVSNGKPTVVTFATPAYCQTATCGPQVAVVTAIKDQHRDSGNFIHIEVYDNPNEIQGDLSRAKVSPILEEWGLQTEPFTFVLDSQGLVAAKFEGFVSQAELSEAFAETLGR